MPETRYRESSKYPHDLPAAERVTANAEIVLEPYEVSDEQLADEAKAKEVRLIIEQLPDKGINKAWKRLVEKGILP